MTLIELPPRRLGGDGPTQPPLPPGPAGVFARALAGLRAELAEVAETPTFALSGDELNGLLGEVTAVSSALTELQARLVAEADSRGHAKDMGCTSTTGWVRTTTGLSGAAAGRLGALARAIYQDRVGPTRIAWMAGRLTGEQALVIAEAINKISAEVDADRISAAQQDLIDRAGAHPLEDLRRLANRVIEVVDPDTADAVLGERLADEERRALETTRLRFSRMGDGTTRLTGRLPDLAADMFKKALDGLAAPRRASAQDGAPKAGPDQDDLSPQTPRDGQDGQDGGSAAAEAEQGPARSPLLNPDGDHSGTEIGLLSYQQRLGRALVELVEHLPTDELPTAGGLNATVVVTVSLESLRAGLGAAVLDTGTEISPGQARRLACNANLVPIVLGGRSRILDLGLGQRLFDRHQRLALATRDRGCVWPGCDRPPAWCEAHHLCPWSEGGGTDLGNGALVCGFHHRLLHQDWDARMAPDGVVEIIPPARIDPTRTPLRHARFKHRQPC